MTSQINPNNVNGNFPIAGVPNSTQGFRDNFTNIKTNFEFAENEIDDLQSKAILKSALAGGTLDNNVGNNLVYNARVQGISGTLVQIANTAGFINIDASAGPYQSIVMGGNINLAFTANTWPSAGAYGKVRLEITGTTGQTITLPSAVTQGTLGIQGINAGVITLAASGTYEFDFSTSDGGSTLTVFDLNRPLNYYTNPLTVAATTVSTSAGSGALVVSGGVGIDGNLYVSGNIVGSVVATGNTFVGNTTVGNLLTAGFVSAGGNVTGGNVLTGGVVSATGNITGGNLLSTTLSLSGNVLSAINLTANVTTTANIAGGNLKSTGIMSTTGNVTGGNISSLGLITTAGNVIGGNLNTAGGVSSIGNINSGNVLTGGLVSAVGNITGSSILTGGSVSATGNIDGGNVLTANVNATIHTGTTVSVTGNITGGNVLTANVNATTHTGDTVSVTGNITGGNVLGGANVNATTHTGDTVSVTGNITGGNVSTAGLITATGNVTGGNINTGAQVVATGNITGGNINTVGVISATGNISANVYLGNGSQLTGVVASVIGTLPSLSVSGNIVTGNLNSLGLVSAVSNVAGGNLITAGNVYAPAIVNNGAYNTKIELGAASGIIAVTIDGNATQFLPGGQIRLGGAKTIYGGTLDGSQIILGTAQTDLVQNRDGNVTVQVGTGGATTSTWTFTNSGNLLAPGAVSAVGNVTGGNLSAVDLVINNIRSDDSSFVNIEDGVNVTGDVVASGNITGGNVLSDAVVSAVGNATILSGTAIPAGGTTGAGYKFSSTTNLGVFFGSGSPTLSAAQGSLYLRTDGTSTNDRMYVNTDGGTTWTAVTTAA